MTSIQAMTPPSLRLRNSRPNSPGSRVRLNTQRPAHCARNACSSTIQPSVCQATRAVAAPIFSGELSMPICESVSAVRCNIGSSCAMTGVSARTGSPNRPWIASTSRQDATASAWKTKLRLRLFSRTTAASAEGRSDATAMSNAGPAPKAGVKAHTSAIAAPARAASATGGPAASRQRTTTPAGSHAAIGSATSATSAASPAARKARNGFAVVHWNSAVIGTRRIAGLRPLASVLVGVWQEREVARPLDRDRELALVERTRARDAARDDLAGFRDVGLEGRQVLVVDLVGAVGRELAELLAPEKT